MPIDDRLDWETVAHIHHGILCSHQKRRVHVLCRDMDEPGDHHSQQTDTRTENQTPHVLIHGHKEGNITHWGLLGGLEEGQCGSGELGRDSMGRNARYR